MLPTEGLLWINLNNFLEPMANDEIILPGRIFFWEFVMHPFLTRSTTPSLNISVWIPRSLWLKRNDSTAFGMFPIPIIKKWLWVTSAQISSAFDLILILICSSPLPGDVYRNYFWGGSVYNFELNMHNTHLKCGSIVHQVLSN